jgi:hypothetical protein
MTLSTAGSGLDVVQTSCVLLGQPVQLEHVPVWDELERRARYGLGAVCDRELLGVLFALPTDLPVPRNSLTSRQLRLLRRAPEGTAEFTRRDITRRAVPPIRVRHVTLHARPTPTSLRALSVFGPFCARTLCATTAEISDAAVVEAQHLGIAIATPDGESVCRGREFRVHRHSAATWLFLEQAASAVASPG